MTARDADRAFTSYSGQEQGDPIWAAAAIIATVRAAELPIHMLLGKDVVHYAEAAIARLQVEIDRWRELSLSTTFDQ